MTYTPVFAVKYTFWKYGKMEYTKISIWGSLQ
jgi:hypothetical protein